jgi:hypothetical protein
MNRNETSEKPACGCVISLAGGRHARKCLQRGRDKMTAAEVAADEALEKEEQRKEAAAELIGELRGKLDSVLPIVKGALDASKEIRGMLPWQELADELRGLFGTDLAPFGKLFQDAAGVLLWESAKQRADVIKRLSEETSLPMEICVQIVLVSSADITNAIKNIRVNSESDKKK